MEAVLVQHSRTDTFLGLVQLSRRIYVMSILRVVFQPCGGVNRKSQGLRSYPNPLCDPSPPGPALVRGLTRNCQTDQSPTEATLCQRRLAHRKKSCCYRFPSCCTSPRQQIRGC